MFVSSATTPTRRRVGANTPPALRPVPNWVNCKILGLPFEAGDIRSLSLAGDFDALVGRYVLMSMPDPAQAMREIVGHLRPGGIAAFQERILRKDLMPSPFFPFGPNLAGLLMRLENPAQTQRWDSSYATFTSGPGFLTFTWRPIDSLGAEQIGMATPISPPS